LLKRTNFPDQQLGDLFGHFLLPSACTTLLSQESLVMFCRIIIALSWDCTIERGWNKFQNSKKTHLSFQRLNCFSHNATPGTWQKVETLTAVTESNTTQLQELETKFETLDGKITVMSNRLETVVSCVGILAENQIRLKVQETFGNDFGKPLKSLVQLANFFVSSRKMSFPHDSESESEPAVRLQEFALKLLKTLHGMFWNLFRLYSTLMKVFCRTKCARSSFPTNFETFELASNNNN
jgi:hypothetical protein